MGTKLFHMALFLNFRSPSEDGRPWSRADIRSWTSGAFHLDAARAAERACFDCVVLEDSCMIGDAYGGTMELDLRMGLNAPKLDPLPLVPMLGAATSRIGFVPTLSTSFYPPFLLARAVATIDHLTGGRAGWNIVTSSSDRAAQNFGMAKIPEHDLRYEQADEFVEIVRGLWKSWEPEAVVQDWERGVYIDHNRVHPIHYEGRFYNCRGPLNMLPPVQGEPVLCQAGQSPRGMEFAAKNANMIVAAQKGIAGMRGAREKIRAMVTAAGRNPDDCKILFQIAPILADTMEEAKEKQRRLEAPTDERVLMMLGYMAGVTGIDFSTFALDAPLPGALSTEGHRGMLDEFLKKADGRTLRQVVQSWNFHSIDLVGTPDSVAAEMCEAMEEVGGDGFLVVQQPNRAYVTEITEGLAPALQRRGGMRKGYDHALFKENLLAF